jgi:hypothetical protein
MVHAVCHARRPPDRIVGSPTPRSDAESEGGSKDRPRDARKCALESASPRANARVEASFEGRSEVLGLPDHRRAFPLARRGRAADGLGAVAEKPRAAVAADLETTVDPQHG